MASAAHGNVLCPKFLHRNCGTRVEDVRIEGFIALDHWSASQRPLLADAGCGLQNDMSFMTHQRPLRNGKAGNNHWEYVVSHFSSSRRLVRKLFAYTILVYKSNCATGTVFGVRNNCRKFGIKGCDSCRWPTRSLTCIKFGGYYIEYIKDLDISWFSKCSSAQITTVTRSYLGFPT
jgi:hypothetical protein